MGARKRSFGKSPKNRRKAISRANAQVIDTAPKLNIAVHLLAAVSLIALSSYVIVYGLIGGKVDFVLAPVTMVLGTYLAMRPLVSRVNQHGPVSPVDASIMRIKNLMEHNK